MSQPRSKTTGRLASALRDQTPVTVYRKSLNWDETSGFVIALSDDWVVIHDLDGVYLDEVVILRLDLVTHVEPHPNGAFVRRAVDGLGEPIESFECASDATIASLLATVAERAELVGVDLESGRKGDWFNVGKIQRIGKKRLDLQFIRRGGDWVNFVDAWKLKDITRIKFGGRYIGALERFGEPITPARSRKKR